MSLDSILRATGKNLFDINSVTGFVNSSGNIMSENNMKIQNGSIISNYGMYGQSCMTKEYVYLPVGTYTISADVLIDNANANPVYIGLYELDKKINLNKTKTIPLNQTTRVSATVNVVKNGNYHILTQGSGKAAQYTNLNAVFSNIQLEKGLTATTYEPYEYLGPKTINLGRKSKNLILYPYTETTKTQKGITFTDNGDGTITVNGTSTGLATFTLGSVSLDNTKSYFLSGKNTSSNLPLRIQIGQAWRAETGNGLAISQASSNTGTITLGALKGFTFDNVIIYPQLEEGTVATDYELNTGSKEVLKVSYNSRNLWQNTNTTFPSTLSYDSNIQTYTLGTGTTGYNFIAHKLTNPIPAGTTVTISVIFQSGKGKSISIGGYHRTGGRSWQGHIDVPLNVDVTGQTLTNTFTTTETVEEFMVFHNTGDNIEEPVVFKVQYELGNKATDYVPYFNTTVWTK